MGSTGVQNLGGCATQFSVHCAATTNPLLFCSESPAIIQFACLAMPVPRPRGSKLQTSKLFPNCLKDIIIDDSYHATIINTQMCCGPRKKTCYLPYLSRFGFHNLNIDIVLHCIIILQIKLVKHLVSLEDSLFIFRQYFFACTDFYDKTNVFISITSRTLICIYFCQFSIQQGSCIQFLIRLHDLPKFFSIIHEFLCALDKNKY